MLFCAALVASMAAVGNTDGSAGAGNGNAGCGARDM